MKTNTEIEPSPRILSQTLSFGKYKGDTLKQVLREHPEYIVWLYEKVLDRKINVPEWLYAICLRDCWSSGDYGAGYEELDPYGNGD